MSAPHSSGHSPASAPYDSPCEQPARGATGARSDRLLRRQFGHFPGGHASEASRRQTFVSDPLCRITPMRFARSALEGSPESLGELTAPSSPLDELDGSVARMTAASAGALQAVAEICERELWRSAGATSPSGFLAARYRLSWGTAREWVRVARALRELPEIARSYREGRLSWDQLRPVVELADEKTDAFWADRAARVRPATLWRELERRRKLDQQKEREARRLRSLRIGRDQDLPLVYLDATLPAEEGAAVEEALRKRAEQVVLGDDPSEPREARMADALVELVTSKSGGGPVRPVLVVHADAEVLLGAEGGELPMHSSGGCDEALPGPGRPLLAETESGDRLSPEAIRRLVCDASVEWVLEDRDGRPVGVGRQGRTIPPWLDRLLRHRDPVCRFPGCERVKWLVAHHIVHWADGGPTDLANLARLCVAHHCLIHEGGWRISGDPHWELRFHDPGGRALPRASEPLGRGIAAAAFP